MPIHNAWDLSVNAFRELESSSSQLAPARYDASPDTATWDPSGLAAPAFAHPTDRLSYGSLRSVAPCARVRHNHFMSSLAEQATDPGRIRPGFQRNRAARHRAEDLLQGLRRVRTRCSNWIWPASSTKQYQLLRSPQIQSDGQFLLRIRARLPR
jgi:hypothetical protein